MIQKCSSLLNALSMLLIVLTGCAPDPPTMTVAPTPSSPPAVMTSTSTPAAPPSAVATRTRTPISATTSAPALPAVSVTPDAAASASSSTLWQDARVLSGGFLDNWEYLVIFETSSPLQGAYSAVVDLNKAYQCEVRPAYPQRLYCWGRQVRYEADAPIVVYNDRHEIVFEGQFHTPAR